MRTPTNVYLLNLSAADVLVLLVCQPAALLEFFGKDRRFLGDEMSTLVPMMENGVVHVSVLTMLAVTFERYQALCHPLKNRIKSVTICATVKVIAFIWLVGIVLSLPLLGMTQYEDALFYDGSQIKVCRTKVNKTWQYVFSLWRVFAPKTDLIKLGLEAYLNLVCWVRILMYMNSTGNPIIYSLTSTKFKAAYTAILGCHSNRNVQGSVTYRQ
ncbi:orexin/Hypocretin receptor type 1-like [Ruditapes philippinarum]|uniref:orexin/Hypocretin receptor type 1-like n=1 Tax=Ruditapes philippinarum TaxID=129788 RepID=UPI00295B07CD|nr:orexin/Hypocretin receptor type 1-like [Ruditapes philippinarum]